VEIMPRYCSGCEKVYPDNSAICTECGQELEACSSESQFIDNRYEIRRIIKEYNNGCLCEAFDFKTNCTVAIKLMNFSYFKGEKKKFAEKSFMNEASLMSTLDHKCLPKLHDVFVAPDPQTKRAVHYMVMSFIEGKNMGEYLREFQDVKIPFNESLSYFRQLIYALLYLHTQAPPIIYGNLKPSNIMLKDGKLFLIDFSASTIYKSGENPPIPKSDAYIAPEQLEGNHDPRSDIYSLGKLMHYLFTGQTPIPETSPDMTKFKELAPEVPDYIASILESMIKQKIDERPGSINDIIAIIKSQGNISKKAKEKTANFDNRQKTSESSKKEQKIPRKDKETKKSEKKPAVSGLKTNKLSLMDVNEKVFKAVRDNNCSMLSKLLAKGADINIRDPFNWTPLHRAAAYNNKEIALLLIEFGADINAKDNCNWTPLHRAANRGCIDVATILVELGADPEAKDKLGMTPLHRAAEADKGDIIRFLASRDFDVNSTDGEKWTPLYRACIFDRREAAIALLECGANPETINEENWTPLHEAVFSDLKEIAEILISKGANINARSSKGATPLQLAKKCGSEDVINLLLSNNKSPDKI
jgi:ankyrin repeat protein/tRNA A-37 threonylcarbamoyl transferase component Bud32